VRPGRTIRVLVAAGIALNAALGTAAASQAAPVAPPAQTRPTVQADPVVGPNARDESRHRQDTFHFAPASTPILPRRTGAAIGRGGSAAASSPAVSTSSGALQREVFGFAPYWELSNHANWNYSLLSTVAYFGIDLNADGSINTTTAGWSGWTSQDLVDTINGAHQAGDRVVVVFKTFDEASINQIVTSPTATQTAIGNVISAILGKNLDGVNIDFEGNTNPSYPNISSGFTNFMTQLSSRVHQTRPGAMVSADTYSGSASGCPTSCWQGIFNIKDLAPVVDAFFIMAYDMAFGNLSGHAGPNAPLNGWTYNDTTSVSQYLSVAPSWKVILGVPYYGYKYSTVSNQPYAAESAAMSDTYSGILDDFSCALQLQRAWDDTAQSPWASWWSPATNDPCTGNHNSWRELYYDNAQSLGEKYDLVNASNLRGAGIWALGYDGTSTDLSSEIWLKFVAQWDSQGGMLSSGPGTSSWGTGRLDLFARCLDNSLCHKASISGAWGSWDYLGGQLSSDPAAVSWATGRIDVFARGPDLGLWHKWFDAGTWSDWQDLGGVLASGPSVSSWASGRLDIFAECLDRSLCHKWYDGTGWSAWQSLGGQLISDPAAISWGSSRIDVFAQCSNGSLCHKWYDGTGWSAWQGLGGILGSSPAASSWGPGRLDVFARCLDGTLCHKWFDASNGWSIWDSLGGQLTSAPAAVSSAASQVDIFVRGTDVAIWHKPIRIF
jgi:hypothetical protein